LVNAGTLNLNRVHVRSNWGTGIENTGHLTLNQSAVTNNGSVGSCSPGISNDGGTIIVNNSTVSENDHSSEACPASAGIYNRSGLLYLNNATVANNNGGGVSSYPAGSATLQNSIVAGNTLNNGRPLDCNETQVLNSSGYNLIGAAACTLNSTESDMVGSPEAPIDAGLRTLKGTPAFLPLKNNSPAINAGNPHGCADHLANPFIQDQRGVARVDRCDIGAVELFALDESNVIVSPGNAIGGDEVSYHVTLVNAANVDLTGAAAIDALPGELTYVPGTLAASSGEAIAAGQTISWTGNVPAQSQVHISYSALVTETVRLGQQIANLVQVSGSGWSFSLEASFLVDGRLCGAQKYSENPVLTEGNTGDWDDGGVWGPAVIKHNDQYMMWYTGRSNSDPTQIGLATSDDGIHWDKSQSNPVLVPTADWELGGVGDPAVIYNGKFLMWYTGTDDNGVSQIGIATSFDGITWAKGGLPVLSVGDEGTWNSESVEQPTVIFHNGKYHLWYTGSDGMTARIGKAISYGGGWIKDPAEPFLDIGPGGAWDWLHAYDPAVVIPVTTASNYWLFYNGYTLPAATHIGFGVGDFAGSYGNRTPLLSTGEQGAFDSSDAGDISVLADANSYRAWYAGYDGQYWRIGLITLSTCDAARSLLLPVVMAPDTVVCKPYYAEPFSEPKSGWYVDSNDDREYAYFNDTYRVLIKKTASGWGVTAGAKAWNFRLTVDARKAGGAGSYGVRFAINKDWSVFYDILLSDQYYSVWLYYLGDWTPVVYWTKNSAIHTGDAWNHIDVTHDDNRIKLAINGVQVANTGDWGYFEMGRIGFAVSSTEGSMMDARFDNFALYPVPCD
jgi:uncharacterized repeat protein (TIGR01451 family)